jgi:hypothetical protein
VPEAQPAGQPGLLGHAAAAVAKSALLPAAMTQPGGALTAAEEVVGGDAHPEEAEVDEVAAAAAEDRELRLLNADEPPQKRVRLNDEGAAPGTKLDVDLAEEVRTRSA